jgi:hypothetical protein
VADAFPLDLSDDLLRAIGSVSAQWATLEYYMLRTTHLILQRFANEPPNLSKNKPFNELREAFAAAFMWSNVPPVDQQIGTDLALRIETVEHKRHKLIHGMIDEYTDDHGEALPRDAESIRIMREHPKHYFTEHMSMAQVWEAADEIADINEDMFKLYLRASGIILA